MKNIFFLFSFLVLTGGVFAQNYVQNSSFERFKFCPVSFNNTELDMVRSWYQPTAGTVDYYNTCSVNAGVPKNVFGNQLPKTGKGYIGLIAYAPGKMDYREYIQSEILLPLDPNEKYCIGYYTSLADYSNFGVDALGLHLSKEAISSKHKLVLNAIPQVSNEAGVPIENSEDWTLINGVYTANGGEQFITIGNFYNDSSTIFANRNLDREKTRVWDYSYYYIDDLFLIPYKEDDERCKVRTPTKIAEVEKEEIVYKIAPEAILGVKAIYFPINSWDFDDNSFITLNELVDVLKNDDEVSIEIVGHADKTGDTEYNMYLSKNRADAAYNFLLTKGVPIDRLNISYHGDHIPIARDKSNAAMAKNRRVEFVIYYH